jgi:endogenous inhibitor of DNA gyrase (YacG/DUF329 family)
MAHEDHEDRLPCGNCGKEETAMSVLYNHIWKSYCSKKCKIIDHLEMDLKTYQQKIANILVLLEKERKSKIEKLDDAFENNNT